MTDGREKRGVGHFDLPFILCMLSDLKMLPRWSVCKQNNYHSFKYAE